MDLKALKVLESAATPAPWKETGNGSMIEAPGEPFPVAKIYGYGRFNRKHSKVASDGRLVAALRNLLPEIIALVEATDEEAYDHGEPCDNEPGLVITSCQCGICRANSDFNRKLASLA